MFRYMLTISIVIIGLAQPLTAQDTLLLDKHKIVQLAQERATSLLLAQSQLHRAHANIDYARSWQSGPTLEIETGLRLDADEDEWDRGIAIKQQLDLWRRERVALASAGYEEQQARIRAQRASITATSIKLFYQVIYRKQKVAFLKESVSLHERIVEVAEKHKRAGLIGPLDVQVIRIASARSKTSLAQGQAHFQSAINELRILLGINAETEVNIIGELKWFWDFPKWNPDQHPLLKQLRTGKWRADLAIQQAQVEGRPELEIGLGYQHEEGEDIVHAGIGITLGSPGRKSAQTRAAQADATAAEIIYQRTALRLQQTYISNSKRLNILRTALDAYNTDSNDAIADAVKLAETIYAKGAIPLGDVLSLKRELLEARQEQLTLQFSYLNAVIDTASAAGFTPLHGQPTTTILDNHETPKEKP